MKTEELKALGLSDDQVQRVFASRGGNYLSDLAKRLQTVPAGK